MTQEEETTRVFHDPIRNNGTREKHNRDAKAIAVIAAMLFLIATPMIMGFFGINPVVITTESKTVDGKITVVTIREIDFGVAISALILMITSTLFILFFVFEIFRD